MTLFIYNIKKSHAAFFLAFSLLSGSIPDNGRTDTKVKSGGEDLPEKARFRRRDYGRQYERRNRQEAGKNESRQHKKPPACK